MCTRSVHKTLCEYVCAETVFLKIIDAYEFSVRYLRTVIFFIRSIVCIAFLSPCNFPIFPSILEVRVGSHTIALT